MGEWGISLCKNMYRVRSKFASQYWCVMCLPCQLSSSICVEAVNQHSSGSSTGKSKLVIHNHYLWNYTNTPNMYGLRWYKLFIQMIWYHMTSTLTLLLLVQQTNTAIYGSTTLKNKVKMMQANAAGLTPWWYHHGIPRMADTYILGIWFFLLPLHQKLCFSRKHRF